MKTKKIRVRLKTAQQKKLSRKKKSSKPVPFNILDWPQVDESQFFPRPLIGVDEVGRGCLAGPVYAAAVILAPGFDLSAYTDSKLVSESRREELAAEIHERHQVGIGIASVEEINELNIFHAANLAMRRAVEDLRLEAGHILVDGKFPIKNLPEFQQTPIVKGDLRCKSISAASIVAKVARDRLMRELHQVYPFYDFQKHKGYSTPQHKKLIKKFKPCLLHRKTFSGVKEHL